MNFMSLSSVPPKKMRRAGFSVRTPGNATSPPAAAAGSVPQCPEVHQCASGECRVRERAAVSRSAPQRGRRTLPRAADLVAPAHKPYLERMDFARNNLDHSQSPYLRQHAENPVWWQEWSPESLAHARAIGKPLFVSVGYATCHWCHVMADDTFSDQECADYLNEHFVSVKVDREERPDIDQFLMDFLVAATGQGGWPMNVVLTPDLRPFFATTYLGSQPRFGRPGFREVMEKVLDFWKERDEGIRHFAPQVPSLQAPGEGAETPEEIQDDVHDALWSRFDSDHGGFGTAQKFPPHSTLLYLLHAQAARPTDQIESMLRGTLDAICSGGLHDHLQGGFFRYCTDRQWRIPHFEKMLYDQAMLLWNLSLAARLLNEERYRTAARGVLRALRETFRTDHGLFVSAHDADTAHEEGGTYLWTRQELEELLSEEEITLFARVYELPEGGNFEDRIHLLRHDGSAEDAPAGDTPANHLPAEDAATSKSLEMINQKLLKARKKRTQPDTDRKIITSWNALTGVALVNAYRHLGEKAALDEARTVFSRLWELHVRDSAVAHSSLDGEVKENTFLQDPAALLLLATYLHEDTRHHSEEIEKLREMVLEFKREGQWIEGDAPDFGAVPAQLFDSPTPSSTSMAELALLRRDMLTGELYDERSFGQPHVQDAHNVAALASTGYVYLVESPEPVDWTKLPVNTIQAPGGQTTYCYKGLCTPGLP